MTVEVIEGDQALGMLGSRLDDLHRLTRVPVTARRTWLQTWFECDTRYHPAAVVVGGPHGLDAAAILATRRRTGLTEVVAAGHGRSDVAALPARDPEAAALLARGITDWLDGLRARWRLTLRLVRDGDDATGLVAARLNHVDVQAGDISPVLRAKPGEPLRSYVSRSHWRAYRKHLNRMRNEGYVPTVDHLSDPAAIGSVMGEVESVLRARETSVGRRCLLDDPVSGRFFRLVIDRHAELGDVSLTTLRLSGQMAAYALCFVDDGAYRFWNGRFDPRWARLGAGGVVTDEAVTHALEHGYTEFDFMRGDEPYKESYANDRVRTLDLFAWSGPLGAVRGRGYLAARSAAARAQRSGGAAGRTVDALRRVASRVARVSR